MLVTAIAFPKALHAQICAAFPEYSWEFVANSAFAQPDTTGQKLRKWLGLAGNRASVSDTSGSAKTFALWYGESEEIRGAMAHELQGKGHSVLLVSPGLVNPMVSPLGSVETGLTSFMILPIGSAGSQKSTAVDGNVSLLPKDLVATALDAPVPEVVFVKQAALHLALDKLSAGYVFHTKPLDISLGQTIRLQRAKTMFLPMDMNRHLAFRHCRSVITHDALIAVLAYLLGRDVVVADAAFETIEALREPLASGNAALAAMLDNTRFVDVETQRKVSLDTLVERIEKRLLSRIGGRMELPDSSADQTLCIVVGTPRGVIAPPAQLFQAYNAIQAPANFGARALAKNPEKFAGQEFIVWHRMPSIDWVKNSTGVVRILSRYPCAIPMRLGRDNGFFPILACDRVRGTTDQKTGDYIVQYDLAADIDPLTVEERNRFQTLGKQILPDLQRLQSTWREDRSNVFALTRRFGLKAKPRLLVLGAAPAIEGMPLHTNPQKIEDRDLVKRLLADHPESEILYHPFRAHAADQAVLETIDQLSDRVRMVERSLEVSELAQVVDEFHTVDSPLGFAALLTEKPLTVYGRPAYSGLGLTRDLDLVGNERPLLVKTALDLNSFVGWYYTESILFVDPLTGQRTTYEAYAKNWFPGLGEMLDSIADRLLAYAQTSFNHEMRGKILQVLLKHVKHAHVKTLIDGIDMAEEIANRPAMALTIAQTYAGLGDWKKGLNIASEVLEQHKASMTTQVADLIPRIRARIRSTEDRGVFGHYLLTVFRRIPATEIEKIGTALMTKRYFGAAMVIFSSIQPSNALLSAICRCQISKSDLDGARRTITELVARGAPEAEIEDLDLALNESIGNWPEAMAVLKRQLHQSPGNLDLRLRYANSCEQAGEYEEAHDNYLKLVRTTKGGTAIRALAVMELARMNVDVARSLLEAYLETAKPDSQLYRLMGDCLGFENRLEEACTFYFRALNMDALDTTAYTRLCELERELAALGRAPDPLWSARFRDHVASVRDPSVETLLGGGRLGLLDNDLETMRRNAARAVEIFPNDMRAYAWLGHAITWGPGRRTSGEIDLVISSYRASISAGAEDGWWTSYDFVRSLGFLGQTAEIRSLLREQYQILFVGQKNRTGWPRFMAGAALSDLDIAFGGLRDYPRSAMIRKHARKFRLIDSIEEIRPGEKVMFLSEGGVGDEIRFAIPYPELSKRFPDAVFSVDERLAPLFRRSFPDVAEFIPLPRFHRTRINKDLLEKICDLPDQSLAQFFDNRLWKAANKMDVVMPAPSVMMDLRPNAAAFHRAPQPRLRADPDLVDIWRNRLAPYADTLLVGVIGTSRILEYQRVANYFTPDEFADMYRMQGVTFVSLEYDDDEDLAEYIRGAFGANLLTFPDLDKMDDFDGVLALSKALDCVVGVNTATIELTAFGGVDTIFAAPNAHHIWRDPTGTGQDLFFDNMEVVMCEDPSDKPLVTAKIVGKLTDRRNRKTAERKAAS